MDDLAGPEPIDRGEQLDPHDVKTVHDMGWARLLDGPLLNLCKEPRDPGIYTFVNEDAHSMSWRLAKSSTSVTCSREMDG